MYNISLKTNTDDPKAGSFRQILQIYHSSQETEGTVPKYHPQYISPNSNKTGNLADIYLNSKQKRPPGLNATCAKFPDFFDLQFRNNYWQLQKTTNGTFHLFNAYLDQRNGSVIRIVGTYDVHKTEETFYCQFWYDKIPRPKIVASEVPFWMFRLKWGADTAYFNHPYLITCPVVRDSGQYPISVSLVDKPCTTASNNLKIFYKHVEEKKNFVVCVKGLSFPFEDRGDRLTEWIELVNLLGKFFVFSIYR